MDHLPQKAPCHQFEKGNFSDYSLARYRLFGALNTGSSLFGKISNLNWLAHKSKYLLTVSLLISIKLCVFITRSKCNLGLFSNISKYSPADTNKSLLSEQISVLSGKTILLPLNLLENELRIKIQVYHGKILQRTLS